MCNRGVFMQVRCQSLGGHNFKMAEYGADLWLNDATQPLLDEQGTFPPIASSHCFLPK